MNKILAFLLVALLSSALALPAHAAAVFYADGDNIVAVITPVPEDKKTQFDLRQEHLSAWVKDVNYHTRVGLTERDRRPLVTVLNLITLGLSSMFMDQLTYGISTRVVTIMSDEIDHLKTEGTHEYVAKGLPRLAVEELYDRIKEKPFLLLLVGSEEYEELCRLHPKVKELFENMYIFFHNRAIVLGEDFNKNIPEIERISRDGKGDPFRTWNLLAQYTLRQQETAKLEKRALQDLAYYFDKLHDELRVEEEVRRQLRRKGLLPSKCAMRRMRRKPTIRQRARQIIQDTPDSLLYIKYMED